MKKIFLPTAIFCLLFNSAFAQNNFAPEVKRVAVFKNGCAFAFREGDAQAANESGKITKDGLNLQSFNPNSLFKWNLNLPNGEKEIKYSYKIYVRR